MEGVSVLPEQKGDGAVVNEYFKLISESFGSFFTYFKSISESFGSFFTNECKLYEFYFALAGVSCFG